jgi:hypothetical protein
VGHTCVILSSRIDAVLGHTAISASSSSPVPVPDSAEMPMGSCPYSQNDATWNSVKSEIVE